MIFDWWRKLLQVKAKGSRRDGRKPAQLQRARFKPWIQVLEDRTLLSVQAISLADPTLLTDSASDSSSQAVMSADGRYVAFYSSASNLVPGDTNNTPDVFVKDLQTGA